MKKIISLFVLLSLMNILTARELIHVNFHELTLRNLVKITSKIVDKNILVSAQLKGKVNLIYNKPIYKDEVLEILELILKSNGYKIIKTDNFLNIVESINEKMVEVIYLKNTKANDIYAIIKSLELVDKKTQNADFTISLFEDINAIVLKGAPFRIKSLKKLIQELDIRKQQVYVQAKIIEISERKTKNIGIEYGLNAFSANGTGIVTFASSLNNTQNNNSLNLEQLTRYGYSPKSIQNGVSLGATINLLKQNRALDVISEPSILCLNNKESSIYVGETRSIPTGTTIGTTTTTNFKREDIGLKLIVKPRIADNNKVTLELKTILEDIKEIDAKTGNPNTNKKEVITSVMVNNGESIILGGLIKNKSENIVSKVPLLGDIPYFGELFRNNYNIDDKINLVIIVTPYIIPKSKNLTFIINQLTKLKELENKYTAILLENLNKRKKENYRFKYDDNLTENQKKHKQILKESFGL